MTRPAGRGGSLYFDAPEFAFHAPPELRGASSRHAVAIVGAGPVGLSAALELARHGIASVVLDEKGTVNDGSRAICIARHSLESLQQLGMAERFVGKALGWTHGTSYYRNEPVYRLEMPHSSNERFLPMYNLQQQYIELFLAERAMAEPLIDLRWHTRVDAFTATADGAAMALTTPGGRYTLQADYVLAADGARSAVRQALGLKLQGEGYESRYVIVDVRLRSSYPTERRAFFDAAANPGGTVLVHKQPDDIWRIDYQLNEGEDEAVALAEPTIRARIGTIVAMLGETAPWELEWWSVYKAYTLCLDDYRHGSVLFLGDAAHLVPIFGVRGLNSGFADAMNAAWKLAYVVRGWAPDRLLDSYSLERRGATLDIFRHASRSTRFMSPPTRGFRLLRDAALSLAAAHPFARSLLDPRQSRPYTYRDSALNESPAAGDGFDGGPAPGAPLVNCNLGAGGYLLDHLGVGFTVLYFSRDGRVPAALQTRVGALMPGEERVRLLVIGASAAHAGLVDVHGAAFRTYAASPGCVYLVRPDRHVCARWRSCEGDEIERALDRALAR